MRKFIERHLITRGIAFLMLCLAGLGNAWGEEVTVTFNASTNDLNWKTGGSQSGTKNGITLSTTDGAHNSTNKEYRIYKENTFTISCEDGNITKVVITCSATDKDEFGPGNFTKPTSGSYTYNNYVGTWTGDVPSFSLTASGSQVRMEKIVVTYKKNALTPPLSSLTITGSPTTKEYYVGETPNADGLIANATYSDGSTKDVTNDVAWTFFPETISESTTEVTATATLATFSANFTFNITATESARITDFNDLKDGKKYIICATLSNGTDYYFSTNYIYDTPDGVAQTEIGKATVVTAIAHSSEKGKWAFKIKDNTYLSLKNKKDNGKVKIATQAAYWELSNTNNDLIKMTINGYYLQRNSSSGTTIFGSYNDGQVNVWFMAAPETYNIEISNAGYATLCLPYNAIVPDGITAYTATDAGKYIKLSAMQSGKLAANEGVVLKGEPGSYTFISTPEEVTPAENNQMVGVTQATALSAKDNAYMLTSDNDYKNVAFRLLATDYTLAANKAYLKVNDTEARTLIYVMWDDDATGIENINGATHTQNGAIFNLAGQKLTHAQKGICIINGKLVIK